MNWGVVLAEAIDNSLDAEATHVAITIERNRYLLITDNGRGCTDLLAMVTLGTKFAHKRQDLGRYGVGLKHVALWVGGVNSGFEVQTIIGAEQRILRFNWQEYASGMHAPTSKIGSERDWWLPDEECGPAPPGAQGTTIQVDGVERKFPEGKALDDLEEKLGYLYTRAIKAGRLITLRVGKKSPRRLIPWKLPRFRPDETVTTEIEIDGKKAHITCGIVVDDEPNPRCGFTYFYNYRVIIASSEKGCGDYNSSRICGLVELDDSWKLTTNKQSVNEEEELFAAVEQACLPVLQRAQDLSEKLYSKAFNIEVTTVLQGALLSQAKSDKEKREPGTTHGTNSHTGNGNPRLNIHNRQSGHNLLARKAGTLEVTHDHLGGSKIGQIRGRFIQLNLDNAWIAQVHASRNTHAAALAAATLLALEQCLESETAQLKLRCIGIGDSPDQIAGVIGEVLEGTIPNPIEK